MRRVLQNQKGETIVEVLAAFVMLLLFTAIFGLSLRYARNAATYSEQRRAEAYALNSTLYPANNAKVNWTNKIGAATYSFSPSGSGSGGFEINGVTLQSYTASTTATENGTDTEVTYTFYRYVTPKVTEQETAAQTAQTTTP